MGIKATWQCIILETANWALICGRKENREVSTIENEFSYLRCVDVYALVHMVCTNVDFMQLARYCSGYVTLGIKGDDYLLASQSTL